MRKNYYTAITGEQVVLVSYKKEHVRKYHEWMTNEELRRLTASEPLTLYEEYKMQTSWLNDKNKCTFIVLDKETYHDTKDEVESMIGDVNIYFNDPDQPSCAEVEIMIAEPSHRGQRKGFEATLLMLLYGICDLKIQKFTAKILEDNEKSVAMFKKMGFEFVERSDVFKEVTLAKEVDTSWRQWIERNVNFIKVRNCDIRVVAAITAQRKSLQQQREREKKLKEDEDKDKKEEEKK